MLTDYVEAAMRRAKYKILPANEGFFGEISGFKGVWANHDTLEACRDELREVLEDWMLVSVRLGFKLPVIAGIDLNESKPRAGSTRDRKRKVA
jgi:predicted RNase H-like HicB family nuclease